MANHQFGSSYIENYSKKKDISVSVFLCYSWLHLIIAGHIQGFIHICVSPYDNYLNEQAGTEVSKRVPCSCERRIKGRDFTRFGIEKDRKTDV